MSSFSFPSLYGCLWNLKLISVLPELNITRKGKQEFKWILQSSRWIKIDRQTDRQTDRDRGIISCFTCWTDCVPLCPGQSVHPLSLCAVLCLVAQLCPLFLYLFPNPVFKYYWISTLWLLCAVIEPNVAFRQQSLLIYSPKDYLKYISVNNRRKIANDMSNNTLRLECLSFWKGKCFSLSLRCLGTKIKSPKKMHVMKANYH